MSKPLVPLLSQARAQADAGRRVEALHSYRALLSGHPRQADVWYEYAWLLRREGAVEQALVAYQTALSLGIARAEEVHLNRAVIYSEDLRDPELARQELIHALGLKASYPPALFNLGKLHEDQGDVPQAIAAYTELSEQKDDLALSLEGLARLVQIDPPKQAHPQRLARLQKEIGNLALPAQLRAGLSYALGRCREHLGEFEAAFVAFSEANALAASTGPSYEPERVERHVDATVLHCQAPWTAMDHGFDAQESMPEPLFICGMFRSGSTLLEQVLNAHPQIAAGGELAFFPRLSIGPLGRHATGGPLPLGISRQLAHDYLNLLRRVSNTSQGRPQLVTDKRPDNVLLLPLILQVLPHARILITRRDPLDTGLSVFQQHLDPRQAPYASNLGDIAHYQRQVQRLAEHALQRWPTRVRVFDYDAFVRDPRGTLQPLLAWLGLPWADECMNFHRQRNLVATASHAQVRRALYRESSGRWRAYENQLAPLRDALVRLGYRFAD